MVDGDPTHSSSRIWIGAGALDQDENELFDESIDPYDDQQDFGFDDGIRNRPVSDDDDDYDDAWDEDEEESSRSATGDET